VGDHPLNFYLWGAMGGAAMIGLGLALAQPKRRVLVVTGDGEMLMGIGSLATIAVKRPANLAIAVIDNERYGETGMQTTHTAAGVDIPAMASAAGFARTMAVADEQALGEAIAMLRQAPGPVLASIKVAALRDPFALPARDGTYLKHRFREALLGAGGIA
jgi:thiamine pyrophosphate-dependent acetolactate synthase large subunit-like protein